MNSRLSGQIFTPTEQEGQRSFAMFTFSSSILWMLYSVVQLCLLQTVRPTVVCDSGWLQYNDHCYGIYTGLGLPGSLNNAVRFCRARGADVVIVESPEENDFLQNEMESIQTKSRCFLGIQDQWTEGTFRTLDGEELNYTNFGGTDPDDGNNPAFRENCVFFFSKTGSWRDQNCTGNPKVDTFVCEKDIRYRSLKSMTVRYGARLDHSACQLESHTVSSAIECGTLYLQSRVALSFNVARPLMETSPNCYLMTCTPMDVTSLTPDSKWILYHFPEIF